MVDCDFLLSFTLNFRRKNLLYLSPTGPQSISTFSLQGKRSSGPVPKSLLATVKNRLVRIYSTWNIKLHPIVRVYDHASVSNFCALGLHVL